MVNHWWDRRGRRRSVSLYDAIVFVPSSRSQGSFRVFRWNNVQRMKALRIFANNQVLKLRIAYHHSGSRDGSGGSFSMYKARLRPTVCAQPLG